MSITSRTALLGFSLALAALTAPAAGQAALLPPSATGAGASIEQRLLRIGAAMRDQRGAGGDADVAAGEQRLALGFANGGRGGFANAARGGFVNGHQYYGGGGGFRNGGGGFVNARGGGGFVNGGGMRGGAFRNW
ncbi:MAG: rSAM-associated Gly-rich repeat protein [Aphanothece saxicola GSE-SYN-MK-01-06B]|jgi:rSAM-associated Gly-rich repeat protein|nr:rSAM-associated Gly-rich repeat protein [Aphanothece saxicola GSE-SYN-MK-01-06B]